MAARAGRPELLDKGNQSFAAFCDPLVVPVDAERAAHLAHLLRESPIDLAECAHLTCSDPGLAAVVIRLAASHDAPVNATRFSVTDCIVEIGSDALLYELDRLLFQPESPFISEVRQHSLLAAHIAQAFAPVLSVDPELAYIAALLHDFGRLISGTGIHAIAGHSALYCSVGEACAREWKFPAILVDVIAAITGKPVRSENKLINLVHCACECSQVRLTASEQLRAQLVC